MARLKFTKPQEGLENRVLVIETPAYEIIPRRNGQTDIQYTPEPGDTRTVEISNRDHFNCYPICYIESETTGKTVDIIRAHDRSVVTDEQAREDMAA